ncbi:MSHA biogenesis protein MshK [Zobellella endophytica]|uniref:MSHA biogenesis protein MshK n=1 Tax=Zobellella endophytica TaxID=2116700 RepID=A0A2P7RC24_9GAMM|nr:MSHA biogenesis protein MshK [Zobellella endophytica]PSJ47759.1 MSHA biogenesis protein MshK [Zobellella endophytica]
MVNTLVLLMLSSAPLLQDPTRPVSPEAAEPVAEAASREYLPRLEAVFIGGAAPSAIVDGQRYRPGDRIADYRLLRIERDRILLEGRGARLELMLFPSLVTLSNQ